MSPLGVYLKSGPGGLQQLSIRAPGAEILLWGETRRSVHITMGEKLTGELVIHDVEECTHTKTCHDMPVARPRA